jgi:hypothetical protein
MTELRVSATISRVKEEKEIIHLLFTLSSASKLLYISTFSLQLYCIFHACAETNFMLKNFQKIKLIFPILLADCEYLTDYHIAIFWGIRPCYLVGGYTRFGGTYCIHVQMKMKEAIRVRSSETSVFTYICQTTRRHEPLSPWQS